MSILPCRGLIEALYTLSSPPVVAFDSGLDWKPVPTQWQIPFSGTEVPTFQDKKALD